jgi:uncharacterized protein
VNDLVTQMLSSRSIAVVGATSKREKFGYKIFDDLRAKGYVVYPVHPALSEIDGVPCYKSVKELPEVPETVCLVVPPAVTERVVGECMEMGVQYIWMQPGAESAKAIALCEENRTPCVHNQCIMVLSRDRR